MKKAALFLTGLLMAICAARGDCVGGGWNPPDTATETFQIVAKCFTTFTEDSVPVMDTFALGKNGGKTNLYVQESISQGWKRITDANFYGCNIITCDKNKFTRTVYTGSSRPGAKKKDGPVYKFCGHGAAIMYKKIK